MLKDITLGQFFPGDSPIHRIDPRFKLAITFIYIVTVFIAKGVLAYSLCAFFLVVIILLSRIKPILIFKSIKPLFFIIVFTAVLNVFYTSRGNILFEWRFLVIRDEGVYIALMMIVRIIMLVVGTSLLTYTTSPISLTNGLESIMQPLKKIRVPVHELSMMMAIALRMIPTLIEETDKIINAQKARGADFDSGNILKRAKALVPVLVPLFISAFRRADELAQAMVCRCYNGGEGRTRLKELKSTSLDYFSLFASLVACAAIISLGIFF